MASLQLPRGASSEFSLPIRQNHSPRHTLNDLPHELSAVQLQAKQILAHLLSRLKDSNSIYNERYGKWIESHLKLEDFCFHCVRPQVWKFLQGRWSLETLKLIGGELKFEGRGVYLNGVFGLDKRVRIYVGQTTSVRQRVSQHLNFRYRRDNPSLHYLAMQQSIYNSIGLLALLPSLSPSSNNLPGMDRPDLLLNVLEMWMCLVFRSLPAQTLELWLSGVEEPGKAEKESREGDFGGLNIASPLDQGDKVRDWIDLSNSDDPLILDYIGKRSRPRELEERRNNSTEIASKFPKSEEEVLPVPHWAILGGLAAVLAFVLFNNRGGSHLKLKGHIR